MQLTHLGDVCAWPNVLFRDEALLGCVGGTFSPKAELKSLLLEYLFRCLLCLRHWEVSERLRCSDRVLVQIAQFRFVLLHLLRFDDVLYQVLVEMLLLDLVQVWPEQTCGR